jgi:hypothetical protein
MKYRRIEFAVRARPGRDGWTWTIYPKYARDFSREFTGSREEAIRAACRKIDRWRHGKSESTPSLTNVFRRRTSRLNFFARITSFRFCADGEAVLDRRTTVILLTYNTVEPAVSRQRAGKSN